MKNYLILTIFMFALFTQHAYAETDLSYRQNSYIDLKFSCNVQGTPCSNQSSAFIFITYPNITIFVDNANMTRTVALAPNNLTLFNYTLLNSSVVGIYSYTVNFYDPLQSSVNQYGQYTGTFTIGDISSILNFYVCPTNNAAMIETLIFYFLFLGLFIMTLKYKVIIYGLIGSLGAFVMSPMLYSCNTYIGLILYFLSAMMFLISLMQRKFV